MAPNSQDRDSAPASHGRLIALALGAAVLLVCVAQFARWQAAPPVARTVAPSADVAVEGSAEVDALVNVEGVDLAAKAREAVLEEPAGVPQVTQSRPAYPVPSELELATLDVLSVWEFTDEPAVDQLLQCGTQLARTDAFGRVRFAGIPPGYWGLTNCAGSHTTLEFEPGELRSMTFPIRREFTVAGRVVDEAGAPVEAADVLVCGSRNGASVALVKTGTDGAFRLDALTGWISLSARHTSFGTSDSVAVRLGSEALQSLTLTVRGGTGALQGIVVDPEGFTVSGASIRYAPLSPESEMGLTLGPARAWLQTDEEGGFEIGALRTGPGELQVRTADHIIHVSSVEIMRDETNVVRVQLASGAGVGGRVLDEATGEPVAQVGVFIGEEDDPAYCGAVTNARGEFFIEQAPLALAELRVKIMNEVVHSQPIRPTATASTPLEIRIKYDALAVHGFVVDEQGNPVVGCEVGSEGEEGGSYSVDTDDEGAFFIPHSPKSATALVVYDGNGDYQLASLQNVLPAFGPVTIVVPSERLQTGKLRGLVVDPDGKPARDYDAEVELSGGMGWLFTNGLANGTFGFDAIPVGKSALVIRAAGYIELLTMVDVKADETLDLGELFLQKGATFRLDLSFDPPLGEKDRVEIWENRLLEGGVRHRLYLGDARDTEAPLGPVPPGPLELVLEGAGIQQTFQLHVETGGATRETLDVRR